MMTTTHETTARRTASQVIGHDIANANSVSEAMRIAGLDYTVNAVGLDSFTVMTDSGMLHTQLPGHRLIHRADTGQGFGVVGGRYVVVQNADAFGLADNLRAAGACFDSAGEGRPGRPYMTLALPDATVKATEIDDIVFRILLATDHRGSGSITGEMRAERLVCTNGMTVAVPGISTSFSIRHTASADARLAQAREVMAEAHQYAKSFQSVARELLDTPMSHGDFTTWIDSLYPRPGGEGGSKLTRWENRRAALLALYRTADTQSEGRGTRWAGFNAVTEYLSWEQPMRGGAGARALRQLEDVARPMRDRALKSLMA